jgi:hypothetical protein
LTPGFKQAAGGWARALRWLACLACAALFVWSIARFYIPGRGFTYLIEFGDQKRAMSLPELKAADHVEMPRSFGYDAQWYAQIAMHPRLGDPSLRRAVDRLPYRARRILFEWTAWAVGLGDPERAMNVYALQNVACWLGLAVLLFRWFPPLSWGNCLRWAAVLFSFGLIFSVRRSLLEGPSLLLIAAAMALLESGRTWAGALVMGIGGLGKETNVLGACALKPPGAPAPAAWRSWLGQVALVLLPLALWMLCLRAWLGRGSDAGLDNFAAPFVGLRNKLVDTASSLAADLPGFPTDAKLDALVLAGLLVQFLFFASRIRWREPWWRLGAGYAFLLLFLGDAVWRDYPSAAARVLLPMTLAFNVLVPRGRWWALLLVAGNIGVVGSANLLKAPESESQCFTLEGPKELIRNKVEGTRVDITYGPRNWWTPERYGPDYWRWSRGDCTIAIHNPQRFAIRADISFGLALSGDDERSAIVTLGGKTAWSGKLKHAAENWAAFSGVVLKPGDTVLLFQSDRPPTAAGGVDSRQVTFSVRDFKVVLKERI